MNTVQPRIEEQKYKDNKEVNKRRKNKEMVKKKNKKANNDTQNITQNLTLAKTPFSCILSNIYLMVEAIDPL